MAFQLIKRNLECKNCRGKGNTASTHQNEYSSDPNPRDTCITCKGKKVLNVCFFVDDSEKCSAGCDSGRFTNDGYDYGTNFLGQETRKPVIRTSLCECCFGTNANHYWAEKEACSACNGRGHHTTSEWVKGWFGSETKKITNTVCNECNGAKFFWVSAGHTNKSQWASYSNDVPMQWNSSSGKWQ